MTVASEAPRDTTTNVSLETETDSTMVAKTYYHPYHPYLFALMTFCSLAELGLTAFLITMGNEHHTWPSIRYHSLLILFCFDSVWTMVFSTAYLLWIVDGSVHVLASIASSVIWLIITTIVWGTASGVMHNTRGGHDCPGAPANSRCRQSLTVEALGWTEFSLCVVALLATLLWVHASRRRYVSDSRRFV